jgi:hypothetical protein
VKKIQVLSLSGILVVIALFSIYQVSSPLCGLWCFAFADVGEKLFVVTPGETIDDVGKDLEANGYIRSDIVFKLLSYAHLDGGIIEPGAYAVSKTMNAEEVYDIFHTLPERVFVYVPRFGEAATLAQFLAEKLSWEPAEAALFADTYKRTIMEEYKQEALEMLAAQFKWEEIDRKIADKLFDLVEYELLSGNYDTREYLLPPKSNADQAAALFLSYLKNDKREKDAPHIILRQEEMNRFAESVRNDVELRPDIVPAKPYDLSIVPARGRTYLVFSSAYWNQGKGPLELIPELSNSKGSSDVRTEIIQRIYLAGGGHRDKLAGIFLWHGEHGHYHYGDFMDYSLTPITARESVQPVRQKTSFCIRDRDLIKKLPGTPREPKYVNCGTDIQGVSVGWGDIYKYTLADQDIDVTGFSKGLYRLRFDVNSNRGFDEINTDNNSSEVLIYLDPARQFVEIRKN